MARLDTLPSRKVLDQNIASGQTNAVDVVTDGYSEMLVIWRLMGTTTVGDLTLNDVKPYANDGGNYLVPQAMAADSTVAPSSDGTDVFAQKRYRLCGLTQVWVQAKNNNAASKECRIFVTLIP